MHKVRINLNRIEMSRAGKKLPAHITKLINDVVEEFCTEYAVTHESAYEYLFTQQNSKNFVKLLQDRGIAAEHYSIDLLPSWGVLINNDDPTYVEYKLKYGQEK